MNLANKVTMFRIILIPLFMLAFQQYPPWMVMKINFLSLINQYGSYLATAIFIVAAITDKLDGYIARKYNQVTNFGKLMDPLADKLLVLVALVMMVQHSLIPSWMAVAIIGREVMVSYLRIRAASKKVALAADKHGKMKLVIQVVAIVAVLLGNFPFSYITEFPIDLTIMILAVAITIYSGYEYLKNNYKELQLEL